MPYNVYGDRVDQFTGRPVPVREARESCPDCGEYTVTRSGIGPGGQRYAWGFCLACEWASDPEWAD